jgi:hypothetical protein
MGPRLMGYFFCTLAMIGVGSTVVASKLIAHGLPPFTATASRFAIAFPLLVLAMKLTREGWPRVTVREALLLVVQSAAGSVGYTVLLLYGMRLTSATDHSAQQAVTHARFAVTDVGGHVGHWARSVGRARADGTPLDPRLRSSRRGKRRLLCAGAHRRRLLALVFGRGANRGRTGECLDRIRADVGCRICSGRSA